VLLWPIFSGGLVLAEPALIFVASVEMLLLFGAAIVLRSGALPLEQAAGWSVLLFVAAAANGELIDGSEARSESPSSDSPAPPTSSRR